jgi:hypothetical protein
MVSDELVEAAAEVSVWRGRKRDDALRSLMHGRHILFLKGSPWLLGTLQIGQKDIWHLGFVAFKIGQATESVFGEGAIIDPQV